MKRCPSCQRTYADDAQAFCFTDGTRLVEEGQAYDSQRTLVAPPPQAQFEQPSQRNPQGRQTGPASPYETQGERAPSWPQPSGQSGAPPWPQQAQPPQQQTPSWGQSPAPYQQSTPLAANVAQGKRRGLGLASFVLGILSIQNVMFIFFRWIAPYSPVRAFTMLFGLIALTLGAVALTLSFTNSTRHAGRVLAVFGIIAGFISFVLIFLRTGMF